MTYDPDPLYVPEPDSDEAHYEAAAAYFERLDEQPEDRRGFLALVFMATLVILAILAAALLIAAPRSGQQPPSTAAALSGVPYGSSQPETPGLVRQAGSATTDASVGLRERRREARTVSTPMGRLGVSGGTLPDTSTVVSGTASWYCGGGSACTRGYPEGTLAAAAGPALRVGDWRGRIVKVCELVRDKSHPRTACVKVSLVDWCACPRRLIDLYRSAFARLAAPSEGVVRVSISWGGTTLGLPPTDTGG